MGTYFPIVTKILFEPAALWRTPEPPPPSIIHAMFPFALVLPIVPTASLFIGRVLIGVDLGPFGQWRYPPASAALGTLIFYCMMSAGIAFFGGAIYLLHLAFKAPIQSSLFRCIWVAALVSAPLMLAGPLLMYNDMTPLWFIVGLSGAYHLRLAAIELWGIASARAWHFAGSAFVLYYIFVVGLSMTAYRMVNDAAAPSMAEMLQKM
jgi:hypothetical protein